MKSGKDWNDFGTNFHLRRVVGTNEMELNLGCTIFEVVFRLLTHSLTHSHIQVRFKRHDVHFTVMTVMTVMMITNLYFLRAVDVN